MLAERARIGAGSVPCARRVSYSIMAQTLPTTARDAETRARYAQSGTTGKLCAGGAAGTGAVSDRSVSSPPGRSRMLRRATLVPQTPRKRATQASRISPIGETKPRMVAAVRRRRWSSVATVARPVTPEVAGSSPVAPALHPARRASALSPPTLFAAVGRLLTHQRRTRTPPGSPATTQADDRNCASGAGRLERAEGALSRFQQRATSTRLGTGGANRCVSRLAWYGAGFVSRVGRSR
jgi:hypothetical protein